LIEYGSFDNLIKVCEDKAMMDEEESILAGGKGSMETLVLGTLQRQASVSKPV